MTAQPVVGERRVVLAPSEAAAQNREQVALEGRYPPELRPDNGFVIDVRVARKMGLKVPQELLLSADEVIR